MVNHVGLYATLLNTQRDHVAQIFLRHQHVTLCNRLTQFSDVIQRRQLGRAIDVDGFIASGFDFIHYRRCRSDQFQIVFTLQTLLNDLHVQQTQEATAEAKAQRGRALWFIEQGGVVQAQLAQRITEGFIIVGTDREQAGIHLWLHFFKAWQHFVCWLASQRQGIAHWRAEDIFNGADQPAHFATVQHVAIDTFRGENPQTVGVISLASTHDLNFIALAQGAVFHPDQGDNAKVVIKPGVDDQRLQRSIRITFWWRDITHQTLQHFRHANAGFCRAAHRVSRINAHDIFDFLCGAIWIGGRQVNLVQHRHHFQIHVQCGIAVSQGLGFYALPGIHHQQCTFTGGQ
ncbi:hypothetical protein D3C79_479860 [compost metagenome]